MSKHTPGPWKIYEDGCVDPVCSLAFLTIGREDDGAASRDEDADAYLISAAPELLEALEYMASVCPAIDAAGEEAYAKACAAIAKAKGEQA